MIEFTIDFLATWRLEGYTHVTRRVWADGFVTLCPTREDLPEDLQVLFKCKCYPIYSPLIDALAENDPPRIYRYFVSDSYEYYRNFDSEYIDIEADF